MINLYGVSNHRLNKNRKDDKNMKICLFSGGFDSTYMLQRLFGKGDDTILIISVVPNNEYSGEKIDREKEARKNIIDHLSKKYPDVKYKVSEVGIDHGKVKHGERRALVQPITWMAALITSPIFQNCPENDKITFYMSYIKGDDALQKRYDICNIIRSSFNILFREECRPEVDVVFPLYASEKSEIIFELMSIDFDLYKLATTCESSWNKEDNCGRCHPCEELKWALTKIAVVKRSGRVHDLAVSELERRFGCSVKIEDLRNKESRVERPAICGYERHKESQELKPLTTTDSIEVDDGDMIAAPIRLADIITTRNGTTTINIPEKALKKTTTLQFKVISDADETDEN